MNQIVKRTITTASIAIIAFAACKKKTDPIIEVDGSIKMKEFITANEKKAESFTVEASSGGSITTLNGTKVQISPNAFVTSSGQSVSGPITIKVTDILKPSDMILNNISTANTNGQFLQSFGMLKVEATQGTNALQMGKPGQTGPPVTAIIPLGADSSNRQIPMWRGVIPQEQVLIQNGHNHLNQPTSVTSTYYTYPGILWEPLPLTAIANSTQTTMPLDSLGVWRNCDVLFSDPRPKTTAIVTAQDFNSARTNKERSALLSTSFSVVFKVKSTNILIKLTTPILNPAPRMEGFLSYQNSFPIGMAGTFLAILSDNNKFYAQLKDITIPSPAPGQNFINVDFKLTEISDTALMDLIRQINSK